MREGVVEITYSAAPQFWPHTDLSILLHCLESNGTKGTRNRIKAVITIKYQHFLSKVSALRWKKVLGFKDAIAGF